MSSFAPMEFEEGFEGLPAGDEMQEGGLPPLVGNTELMGQQFNEMMYFNPVLEAPPFDPNILGPKVGVDDMDPEMALGAETGGELMGGPGGEMGPAMGGEMGAPQVDKQKVREDMLGLMRERALARQQASSQFQKY